MSKAEFDVTLNGNTFDSGMSEQNAKRLARSLRQREAGKVRVVKAGRS